MEPGEAWRTGRAERLHPLKANPPRPNPCKPKLGLAGRGGRPTRFSTKFRVKLSVYLKYEKYFK